MPRDNRPGTYRNRNSYTNSAASGSTNNNQYNFGGYYRNNSNSRNTNYSGNNSCFRNTNCTSNQPSTSREYDSTPGNRLRKLFVNKKSNNKDDIPTTSLGLWKSRNFVDSRNSSVQRSISPFSSTYIKMIEIQKKFPLWSRDYRRNGFQVSMRIFMNIFF